MLIVAHTDRLVPRYLRDRFSTSIYSGRTEESDNQRHPRGNEHEHLPRADNFDGRIAVHDGTARHHVSQQQRSSILPHHRHRIYLCDAKQRRHRPCSRLYPFLGPSNTYTFDSRSPPHSRPSRLHRAPMHLAGSRRSIDSRGPRSVYR